MAKKDKDITDPSLYSLVIYQNDQFVDGLYQAMYEGLLETRTDTTSKEIKVGGEIEIDVSAHVPLVTKASGKGTGELGRTSGGSTNETMSFNQAYYLHRVRRRLLDEGALKAVKTEDDFKALSAGDFVEFRATFEKNDLVSVVELITPELGEAIAFAMYANSLQGDGEFSQVTAASRSGLGRAIVSSLQTEFRNETTSEYYGQLLDVSGSVGAVVICDKQLFASADSDRILDGEFSVVGKVIAKSETGVSKFERNKLLKRITPAGVQAMEAQIAVMNKSSDLFDTTVAFEFPGNVLKIIPIAIYS